MRTTKIVATIGPASQSPDVLEQVIAEGVDAIRFNMSHGTRREHESVFDTVDGIAEKNGGHIARIADLCGPKIRTCQIDPKNDWIATGGTCRIVREGKTGTSSQFSTNHPGLIDDVKLGHRMLIDDGTISLRVSAKDENSITCTCEAGGTIGSQKGVNVPDSRLSLPPLTEKDLVDLQWAVNRRFDFLAMSFVRNANDIDAVRKACSDAGESIPIIAKIETPQAIEELEAIVEAADGVLVARGDLGVEMDVWRIPMIQKQIVSLCRVMGKPVIVATQMLQSMVDQPVPTRAEVSDVANAVIDGADAVMLSAETAIGRYPAGAVSVMNRICAEAHGFRGQNGFGQGSRGSRRSDMMDIRLRVGSEQDRTTSAVARSAALVAHDLGAKLIAVWTRTGRTAQWMSKYRFPSPLATLSTDPAICRLMALSYGVCPKLVSKDFARGERNWADIVSHLASTFKLASGDVIVVVGDPTAAQRAPTLSIHVVDS